MPAFSALISTVAFSDSISQIGSSTLTASPFCLNHRPMVTSLMDSPTAGIRPRLS